MGRQRVKLYIAYDGTDYSGWQIQKNTDATIQQHLEEVIGEYDPEFERIHGACRTDGGVHARAQVAHFDMSVDIPEERIALAINGDLPRDIVCWQAEKVRDSFHSRYQARAKTYRYRIDNGEFPRIFTHRYTHFQYQPISLVPMKEAARYLPGEKDFSSFKAKGCSSSHPVRKIYGAEVYSGPDEEIIIEITGSGFLYNMVRIIAGTLIEIGLEKRESEQMEEIIESRDRRAAGFTAPACGLTLEKVYYSEDFEQFFV